MPRTTTRIDMHSHTKGSDGTGTPAAIALAARRAGLHGLVLSDHHTNTNAETHEVATALRAVGVFPIIACEYSTRQGHLLVFGLTVRPDEWGMYPDMQTVIDDVNARGGACVCAHPYKGYKYTLRNDIYGMRGLAAVEGFNGRTDDKYNRYAQDAASDLGLPTTAGSDAHAPREIGKCWTVFYGRVRGARSFLKLLKAGQFAPHVTQAEVRRRVEERARLHVIPQRPNTQGFLSWSPRTTNVV